MQLPSCTLKHMDSNGAISDISTDELTAGKKVRWGANIGMFLEPNTYKHNHNLRNAHHHLHQHQTCAQESPLVFCL
jgi:hypothetical protein